MNAQTSARRISILAAAIIAALMAATLALTGCSSSESSASASASSGSSSSAEASSEASSASSEQETLEVTMIVSSPAADDQVTYDGLLTMPAGSTVLDTLDAANLNYEAESSQYGPYIASIEGVGGETASGWTYTVNGEAVQSSADEVVLEDGDSVEWSYIDMA